MRTTCCLLHLHAIERSFTGFGTGTTSVVAPLYQGYDHPHGFAHCGMHCGTHRDELTHFSTHCVVCATFVMGTTFTVYEHGQLPHSISSAVCLLWSVLTCALRCVAFYTIHTVSNRSTCCSCCMCFQFAIHACCSASSLP